jgi:hypothetical protein
VTAADRLNRLEQILAKLEQTSYGELIRDDGRRRHELYRMMAGSAEPAVREMGQQLRDGLVTPTQLLTVPQYAEVLHRGYERLGELDIDTIEETVAEVRRAEREAGGAGEQPPGDRR